MPLFTPPPLAPQRGDRATFSQRVDAFLTWLVQLIPQLNDFVAGLNSRNAGGANTFTYSFDSATSDVDPGEGKLRLGSSAQSASNVLRIDLAADGGVDISSILDSIGAVSSNVKGSVRLQKSSDVTAFMIFDVTSIINAGSSLGFFVGSSFGGGLPLPVSANSLCFSMIAPSGWVRLRFYVLSFYRSIRQECPMWQSLKQYPCSY
jgi:hypothetical protein